MAGQSALLRLSIHVNNLDSYLDKSYVTWARAVKGRDLHEERVRDAKSGCESGRMRAGGDGKQI